VFKVVRAEVTDLLNNIRCRLCRGLLQRSNMLPEYVSTEQFSILLKNVYLHSVTCEEMWSITYPFLFRTEPNLELSYFYVTSRRINIWMYLDFSVNTRKSSGDSEWGPSHPCNVRLFRFLKWCKQKVRTTVSKMNSYWQNWRGLNIVPPAHLQKRI
jgi:hypothetical protein